MCSVVLPAGRFFGTASVAPPSVVLEQSTSMAACFEAPPPVPPCMYDAAAASAEMEEVLLCGTISRVGVVEAIRGFFFVAAPAPVDLPVPAYQEQKDGDDTPRTPVAILKAPLSYGDDGVESSVTNAAAKTEKKEDPSWTYDADIDATLRSMEMDPAERPSEEYIWTTQEGQITATDRADLFTWMYDLSRIVYDELPPGTLHRAVSYLLRRPLPVGQQGHRRRPLSSPCSPPPSTTSSGSSTPTTSRRRSAAGAPGTTSLTRSASWSPRSGNASAGPRPAPSSTTSPGSTAKTATR
jgi:hypothetical protein